MPESEKNKGDKYSNPLNFTKAKQWVFFFTSCWFPFDKVFYCKELKKSTAALLQSTRGRTVDKDKFLLFYSSMSFEEAGINISKRLKGVRDN